VKQNMGPLGDIDLLTDSELRASLGHHFDHVIRDWYRGIDYIGVAGVGNGTNTITIPGSDQGYTWSVKLISAQLASAGELSAYPGDTSAVAPIGTTMSIANGANNDAVLTYSSNQVVLKDGRNITLLGSAVILNWRIMVEQVPTEMQGKL
jgi:hypothetical protein